MPPREEVSPQPETRAANTPPTSYGRRASGNQNAAASQTPNPSRNCLIVDDSRMIRKVARQIMEKQNYDVSEAENGQEALDKCAVSMPDLIILDWDMPVMTGIDFLAELRSREGAKRPKVVFCTTHSGAKDIHQAIELGADEFCTKPFNEEGLVAKLEAIHAA